MIGTIGTLPKSLNVNGIEYPIRTDFRVILKIFQAFNDPDLNDREKCYICIANLFEEPEEIPQADMQEAVEQAFLFLDGGSHDSSDCGNAKLFDWEQDEKILFSAVNKSAGFETREREYIHWWTFLGYFSEIGEGLFSTVISIRKKKSKGKKLEKYELDFYREHKKMIDLKTKLSASDRAKEDADNEFIKNLLGGD